MSNHHRASRFDGRGRIMTWVMGVSALGMALLIVAVSFVLRANVNESIQAALRQEAGEINRFAAEGIDPQTSEPFTDAGRFLEVFISRQEGGQGELMVGIGPSGRLITSMGPQAQAWDQLPEAIRTRIMQSGSMGRDSFPETGTLSWSNYQVNVGATVGHIVVVRFHAPAEGELSRELLVLVGLAASALVVTGLVAWGIAGRMTGPLREFEQEARRVRASQGSLRVNEHGSDEYLRLARAANQMLEGAERGLAAQQEFSENLVHIIRTPLTILRADLEDAIERGDQELGRSLDEARRLERAVSCLVLLNRAGRAGFVVPRPVAADGMVRDVVARWTDALGAGSQPRVVLHDAATATLEVDLARVERALDEVLANAVEACRDTGTVEVSSAVSGGDLVIEVIDSGIGIPEGEHDMVLEPFARASNARPDPVDPAAGTGLGLSAARTVLAAHGGQICLAPRHRGGTRVLVRLPLADG